MDHLQKLFATVLEHGHKKGDRTGVGTISMFGYQERFDLKKYFPIVTTKRTAFKAAVTELIWMIGGWMEKPEYQGIQRTNIKFLLDNKVKIWTEWPYKAYCEYIDRVQSEEGMLDTWAMKSNGEEYGASKLTQQEFEQRIRENKDFAIRFGDLGPVYQKQWRDFEGKQEAVDQLQEMINKLDRSPDDRRNLSSYWNPTELNQMLLPPCHMFHQVWTRELDYYERLELLDIPVDHKIGMAHGHTVDEVLKHMDEIKIPKRAISLQMYQRSSDCFLGVPFDWVFYALLTHMLAELTNMVVDEFIWVSGDTHLYNNSLEAVNEMMTREPFEYPQLKINRKVSRIEDFEIGDFELVNYKYHPAIQVAVAV